MVHLDALEKQESQESQTAFWNIYSVIEDKTRDFESKILCEARTYITHTFSFYPYKDS